MSDDLKQQLISEREFLHDMSTPLMISSGTLDLVKRKLAKGLDSDDLEKLEKAHTSIQLMVRMLKGRRQKIKEELEQLK